VSPGLAAASQLSKGPAPGTAYFLVAHGSPDPRPGRSLAQLGDQVHALLQAPDWLGTEDAAKSPVGTGVLECHPQPLHEQICDFVRSQRQTVQRLQILPLFLLAGVHVTEDIPQQVALAQEVLERQFKPAASEHGPDGMPQLEMPQLEILPHLGRSPALHRLITEAMAAQPYEAWILLSHGSRRASANGEIEALAQRLGVAAAYWASDPKLDARVQRLVAQGVKRLGVFPYFLFSGSLTDAIAQQVDQLRSPQTEIHLTPALDGWPGLDSVIVSLLA
jgi:sirohydrochlorin cobaltochelatase